VVSHDVISQRVCTTYWHSRDGIIHHRPGDYDYYRGEKGKAAKSGAEKSAGDRSSRLAAAERPTWKISFKDARELEAWNRKFCLEKRIARIEVCLPSGFSSHPRDQTPYCGATGCSPEKLPGSTPAGRNWKPQGRLRKLAGAPRDFDLRLQSLSVDQI